LYKWNGTRYNALFGVPGGPATSVSLSSDGKAVAVGLPFDASRGGSTRVYSFHPSSPCEDPSEDTPLRISFTTDGRPEETSWELRVDSQVKRRSGSLAGFMYTTFVEEMCVPATSCVELIVYDSHGDGVSSWLNLKITLLHLLRFLLTNHSILNAAESSWCFCFDAQWDGSLWERDVHRRRHR
jgi:hypothetical protein